MKIDRFIDIEKTHDLYNIEINSVKPWAYFRMGFWNYQICKQLLSLSDNAQVIRKKERYGNQLKTLFYLLKRKNKKQICSKDIIFFSHARRIKMGQNYECIYTDKLAHKYQNSIVFENPYQNTHLIPVSISNIFYTDLLHRKASLYFKIHYLLRTKKYKEIYKSIQSEFSRAIEELREIYKFTISCDSIYKQLAQLVLEINILKKEFDRILDIVQPKIIVEVVYYSKLCMVLNETAKEKGIPTVELQHGTMHAAHAAYQYPPECGEIKQFPDYVYVFSDYWKKCAHLPIPEDHVKVTGYPYFESQLKHYKSSLNKEDRVNIIFVSQGTIGNKLSELASDICNLLDENTYHIIYKLHPGEYVGWRERTPWLIKNNIEVVDSLEHNIYEYFATCDIQVGVYSTAIYEGIGFGLRTYIYNIGHADTMDSLCEQGYASYVNDVMELFKNITSMDTNPRKVGKEFWKMNSFENICYEIDQLLMREGKEDIL